jgi:hypothetical protein
MRDKGWDALADADLKWVNLISVNDARSAFCLWLFRPDEAQQKARR